MESLSGENGVVGIDEKRITDDEKRNGFATLHILRI